MATLRSQTGLSRYKSISRPSLRGFSSYSDTLVKRTNSAEDAIVDNQYETGQISAETYKLELTKRLSRSYITPLQRVNIGEKIGKVAQAVQDADVDRRYASGELKTDQVLKYEQDKLASMPATDSVAYLKQQQKVQGLIDKGEQERRTTFRVSENLRISKLPEDTSERLYAKAREYEKLETMARSDGDNQTADVFATNKNNYVQSAKRAEINDFITNTKLSTSQTSNVQDTASAEEGGKLYGQLTGTGQPEPDTSVGQTGVSGSGGSGYTGLSYTSGGTQSPAMKNAFESLDRAQKTINRLYQDKADKQAYISTYEKVIQQATGDQKTQLTIALNNLREDLKGIDNQIENTTANAQDTVVRIQEIQAKQAASNFNQEVRRNNQLFQKVEDELETAALKGKISKQEYIQKGIDLAADKYSFFNQASDGFNQFGNESSAESYLQKTIDMEQKHESLTNVQNNIDNWEYLAVDPGGNKLTNLLGKQLQPGQFALTDVTKYKLNDTFDVQFVKKGQAYYKVYYPAEFSDATGDLLPQYINEGLARLRDTAFIFSTDEKGKPTKENINIATFLDENNKPILKAISKKDTDILKNQGVLSDDPKKGWIEKPRSEPSLLLKGGAKIQETLQNIGEGLKDKIPGKTETYIDEFGKEQTAYLPFANVTKTKAIDFINKAITGISQQPGINALSAVKNIVDQVGKFGKNTIYPNLNKQGKQIFDFVGNAIKGTKNFAGNTVNMLSKFFVPKVEAKAPSVISKKEMEGKSSTQLAMLIDQKAQKYGIDPQLLKATVLTENENLNPNATRFEQHLGESSYGLGQILLSTARSLGFTGNPEDLKNPDINLEYTSKYLKQIADSQKNKGIEPTTETIVREYNSGDPFGQTTQGHLERFFNYYDNPLDDIFKPAEAKGKQKVQIKPKISVTPTVTSSAKLTAAKQPFVAPIPQSNIVRSQPSQQQNIFQNIGSGIRDVGRNIGSTVQNVFKQFNQPKIISPIPNPIKQPSFQLPKIEPPKPIQNVVKQAQQTVQKAVQNVGSFINKFNPFKKK